ncbi:hypothetical protein HY634_04445 [Candidatus Uhrbacteria bacterium]|nr:hypothetical protein [Candidatus Uhrbacteria bacterium]
MAVRVIHGADFEEADLAGRTVSEVRAAYKNVFNIGDDAIVKVNGKEASGEHAVRDGDKVVFEKKADKYRKHAATGEASASPAL